MSVVSWYFSIPRYRTDTSQTYQDKTNLLAPPLSSVISGREQQLNVLFTAAVGDGRNLAVIAVHSCSRLSSELGASPDFWTIHQLKDYDAVYFLNLTSIHLVQRYVLSPTPGVSIWKLTSTFCVHRKHLRR